MLEAIRPGDTIWDVGANVGHYSKVFSETVGSPGLVIAYEPSPHNREALQKVVGCLENVHVMPIALGDVRRAVYIEQGADRLGATSRIRAESSSAALGN